MDSQHELLMAHLEAKCQTEGVAAARVDDGTIVMFDMDTLDILVQRARLEGKERVMVFVRHGDGVLLPQ
jgi:hypothetical protein